MLKLFLCHGVLVIGGAYWFAAFDLIIWNKFHIFVFWHFKTTSWNAWKQEYEIYFDVHFWPFLLYFLIVFMHQNTSHLHSPACAWYIGSLSILISHQQFNVMVIYFCGCFRRKTSSDVPFSEGNNSIVSGQPGFYFVILNQPDESPCIFEMDPCRNLFWTHNRPFMALLWGWLSL